MKKLLGGLALATMILGVAGAASASTITWTLAAPVPSTPPTLKFCVAAACDASHGFVFVSGEFQVDGTNPLLVTGFDFVAQGGTGQMATNFSSPYTFSNTTAGDHFGWYSSNTELIFFGAPGFSDPLLALIFPSTLPAGNGGPVNLVIGTATGSEICGTNSVCAFDATAGAKVTSTVPEPGTLSLLGLGVAAFIARARRKLVR